MSNRNNAYGLMKCDDAGTKISNVSFREMLSFYPKNCTERNDSFWIGQLRTQNIRTLVPPGRRHLRSAIYIYMEFRWRKWALGHQISEKPNLQIKMFKKWKRIWHFKWEIKEGILVCHCRVCSCIILREIDKNW